MAKRRDSEPSLTVSTATAATLVGLSVRQFNRLQRDGALPREARGKVDLQTALPAYIRYLRQGGEASGNLAAETLALTVAKRRDLELKTRQRERTLVAVDEVTQLFEAAMVLIGGQLDCLGRRLAAELATVSEPATIQEILFRECRRIRNAAADQLAALACDSTSSQRATGTAADES